MPQILANLAVLRGTLAKTITEQQQKWQDCHVVSAQQWEGKAGHARAD